MAQNSEPAGPKASAIADPSLTVKLRRKRTRTGCLKCRVRRRKCDERKPRCQRCVDGDFDCRYPSGLTFLEKNAITAPTSNNPTSGKPPAKYSRLQFLEPGASSSRGKKVLATPDTKPRSQSFSDNSAEDGPETTSRDWVGGLAPSLDNATDHSLSEVLTPSKFINHHGDPMTWSPDAPLSMLSPQGLEMHVSPPTQLHPGATPSDGYETALHVLLSLGADNVDATTGTPSHMPLTEAQGTSTESNNDRDFQPEFSIAPSTSSYKHTPNTPISVISQNSKDTIVKLLRHYRYEVAPWLDICDMAQSFGLLLPRVASTSEAIFQSLLELSAASLDAQAHSQSHSKSTGPRENPAPKSATSADSIITAALLAVRNFITRSPDTWESPCKGLLPFVLRDAYPIPKLHDQIPNIFLRLELSVALVTGNRVPLEKLQLVQPQWSHTAAADSSYQYSREPLMLCARAINFIAGDVSSPATEFPIPLAQAWRHIAEELGAWYTNRPEEFQPIVELDLDSRAGERLFPTVLFTNGAAVLANQLYHTAMMVLLQHKPRTLVLDSRRSSAVSPLWHAQRVCGIALNNDRRECWDLSLVSSLYVAAKKMTYEPQQREILRRFDAIARVTGWNIGRFASMLRDEWDISDKG